jgi:hypothetical protein
MRGVAIVSVVICAVTMTVAQGQRSPGPVPAPDRPVPFAPGEMLTYDVSWSNYVSAGTATLSVKERRTLPDGRPAYYVVAEAKPAWLVEKLHHFYYKVDSLLSTRTLLPLQASMYSDEQGRIRLKTTTFVNPTTVDVDLKSATVVHERRTVPAASLDPISTVCLLRTLPFATLPERGTAIPVVDGSSAYTLVVRRAVRETVATPIGSLSAWRVEPTLKDAGGESATARHLVLWVSDDARRLPLRFDASLAIGSVRLTLTSVSR